MHDAQINECANLNSHIRLRKPNRPQLPITGDVRPEVADLPL